MKRFLLIVLLFTASCSFTCSPIFYQTNKESEKKEEKKE